MGTLTRGRGVRAVPRAARPTGPDHPDTGLAGTPRSEVEAVGPLVTLYLEDEAPRVGAGYRTFIVLSVGHKWVYLFHWPTLTRIKAPKEVLRQVQGNMVQRPKAVAKMLRETVEVFKRVGREVPEVTVDEALSVLKGA